MSLAGTTSLALGALALQVKQQVEQRAPAKVEAKQPLPAQTAASQPKRAGSQSQQRASPEIVAGRATTCGDGKCEPPEIVESCFADCPGAVIDPTCGAELHMDPQGFAVVDGRGHHVPTVGACCAACAAHAAKSKSKPCNSWVFCYMPHCWSADNGNTHLFGECWLKWQADPQHPLYGQRGKYTDEFRHRNRDKHLNGLYPPPYDKHSVEAMRPFGIVPGSRRNLSVPTHVAWMGGIMGATVDLSVQWSTDADGTMRSSAGETIVDYRPCGRAASRTSSAA